MKSLEHKESENQCSYLHRCAFQNSLMQNAFSGHGIYKSPFLHALRIDFEEKI